MTSAVIQAWEAVVVKHGGWKLVAVQEILDKEEIKSHGDALHHLQLSSKVIRPVSLEQIRREQKMLQGAKTV